MRNRSDEVVTSLCVSALLSLTLFVFGALNTYGINVNEFSVSLSDILLLLIGFTFATSVCLFLTTIYLGKKPLQVVVSILLALSILSWIQSDLIAWDYGRFNGKEINWPSYYLNGFIDSGVWLTGLCLAILFSVHFFRFAKVITFVLIAMQLLPLIVLLSNINEDASFKRYQIVEENKFQFSRGKNIIILLLDSFQSDVFEQVIQNEPLLTKEFEGVSYFRNVVGGYPFTYASVPLILTGEQYDNSVPVQQFIKEAFLGDSVPRILKKEGFNVMLFPYSKNTIYYDHDIASNFRARDGTTDVYNEVVNILKITLFRLVPHFFKESVYESILGHLSDAQTTKSSKINSKSLYPIQDTLKFRLQLEDEFNVSGISDSFRFFHLSGLHRPLLVDENLELQEMRFDRESIVRSATGMVKLISLLLLKLKEFSIYDNTMVIVLGDHGFNEHFMDVRTQLLNNSVTPSLKTTLPSYIKSSGIPLVLIKPFGAKGKLKTLDLPVSLGDVTQTIFSELKLQKNTKGISMFRQVDESEYRTRNYYYYTDVLNWKELEYLPSMKEYVVNGHSWLSKSWRETGQILNPKVKNLEQEKPFSVIKFDEIISFGKNGRGDEIKKGTGWSYAEESFSWTSEKFAHLEIPVNGNVQDVQMTLKVIPFLADGSVLYQRVRISVLDIYIGEWKVSNAGQYKITIPNELIDGNKIKLVFELPDAKIPLALNSSVDSRKLGIAVQSLLLSRLVTVENPFPVLINYGETIDFRKGGSSNLYKISGWSPVEESLTWTDGADAHLRFQLARVDQDIELTMVLNPFIVENLLLEQKVIISVNSMIVGEWIVNKRDQYKVSIPRELIKKNSLELSFHLPNAKSPAELSVSADRRILGLAVETLVFRVEKRSGSIP